MVIRLELIPNLSLRQGGISGQLGVVRRPVATFATGSGVNFNLPGSNGPRECDGVAAWAG